MKSVRAIEALWVALICIIPTCMAAAPATPAAPPSGPPPYFAMPDRVKIDRANSVYESYSEAEFPVPDNDDKILKQGRHWSFSMKIAGMPDDAEGKAMWAVMKPALAGAGWTAALEAPTNPFTATIRYQKDGKDAWGVIGIFGADDVRVDLVELTPPPDGFKTPAPSATLEKVSAAGSDFPFLPALPGSKRGSSDHDDSPMLMTLAGADQPELVGNGSTTKSYDGPKTLSNLETITTYRNALEAAGWSVVNQVQGPHSSDGVLTVHYAKDGRNIWASLHSMGAGYAIQVADEAAPDRLAATLAQTCHVALTGVLFDFDKATLKPESDPVLKQVLALMTKSPDLRLEVQGHTDNVGPDDYNMTLSMARAKAVMTWLGAHGIAADRLSAHGYGKTQPVASNDDDAGRARNRRVEIARLDCKK